MEEVAVQGKEGDNMAAVVVVVVVAVEDNMQVGTTQHMASGRQPQHMRLHYVYYLRLISWAAVRVPLLSLMVLLEQ